MKKEGMENDNAVMCHLDKEGMSWKTVIWWQGKMAETKGKHRRAHPASSLQHLHNEYNHAQRQCLKG